MNNFFLKKKKSFRRNDSAIEEQLLDDGLSNRHHPYDNASKPKKMTEMNLVNPRPKSHSNHNPVLQGKLDPINEVHNSFKDGSSSKKRKYEEEIKEWDFVILLPNPDYQSDRKTEKEKKEMEKRTTAQEILERLALGGLKTYAYYGADEEEIYIKISASLARLKDHAEEVEFKMKLDENYLQKHVDNDPATKIETETDETDLSPYEYIYAPYNTEHEEAFAIASGYTHPFSNVIRIKLIVSILETNSKDCCCLNLKRLEKDGSIVAFFPIHKDDVRDDLYRTWLSWKVRVWEQPIDDVKDYFGEKVGMYFEFSSHYTTWLIPLSIVGGLVVASVVVEAVYFSSFDEALLSGYTIPFYCIYVSFWAQLMIEYWKRKQATKAMEWGMAGFEDAEMDRPEFFGTPAKSIVNGRHVTYFPASKRLGLSLIAYLVIAGMMVVVIICVSAIFYLQYYIQTDVSDPTQKSTGSTMTSVLSAVQIQVLAYFYNDMAIKLNEMENHRTDTTFDDALISKLFLFSFVNSYASLFYVAFIQHNLGVACQGPCVSLLAYQLGIILITQITIAKVSTFLSLTVIKRYREYLEEAELKEKIEEAIEKGEEIPHRSKLEMEFVLEEYDPSLGTIGDYAQLLVQYGYVTLFVAACPVAPILAYVSNIIEFRTDGWKLLYMSRRVLPMSAEDIGTWLDILQLTSTISVITNAGIICYVMDLITFDGVGTLWVFIGFQYSIFVSMYLFAAYVDDVPLEVNIQLQRCEYLANKAMMSEEERTELSQKHHSQHWTAGEDAHVFKINQKDECPIPDMTPSIKLNTNN